MGRACCLLPFFFGLTFLCLWVVHALGRLWAWPLVYFVCLVHSSLFAVKGQAALLSFVSLSLVGPCRTVYKQCLVAVMWLILVACAPPRLGAGTAASTLVSRFRSNTCVALPLPMLLLLLLSVLSVRSMSVQDVIYTPALQILFSITTACPSQLPTHKITTHARGTTTP